MKNIFETAIDIGNFNSLIQIIKLSGMDNLLNSQGPLTIFAPQDSAFHSLLDGTYDNLLKDKAKMQEILKLHIVSGKYELVDLKKLSKLKTFGDKEINISSTILSFCSVDLETVKLENAILIGPDITCSNGVFHTIDKVLMPKIIGNI